MARPTKQGVDYFPLDVGFFSDVKIRKIARACGPNSASIIICLLCNIYRDEGYYILWDEDLPFVIADEVGVTEGSVKEVLLKAIQVGLFDNKLYEKHRILTSAGIQKRFFNITYQRKETGIIPHYLVNHANNSINCTNNSINHVDNKQSKVKVNRKEIKENPSNEGEKKKAEDRKHMLEAAKAEEVKKLAAAKAATLKRKEEFYDSLIPYVERYGKEMLRNFFDYWSEMNKSQTKMRFEKQPTWEVAKRLATWAKKEKFDGKSSSVISKGGNTNAGRTAGNKAASREVVGQFARAVLEQYKSQDSD